VDEAPATGEVDKSCPASVARASGAEGSDMPLPASSAAAALGALLNRGTGDRSVRAEHAAVSRLGAKQGAAAPALVEVQAGIRRHRLPSGEAAVRAGQHGFDHDSIHDDTDFPISICFNSPLWITRSRSSAPPIRTPLTNTIGKVGHPVHIFNAVRRRQSLK